MAKTPTPCGLWESPLNAEAIFKDKVSWQDVLLDTATSSSDGKHNGNVLLYSLR